MPIRRIVVALALLVLDDPLLTLEGSLGYGIDHVTHAVRVDPEDLLQRILGDNLVVHGVVERGAAVAAAS